MLWTKHQTNHKENFILLGCRQKSLKQITQKPGEITPKLQRGLKMAQHAHGGRWDFHLTNSSTLFCQGMMLRKTTSLTWWSWSWWWRSSEPHRHTSVWRTWWRRWTRTWTTSSASERWNKKTRLESVRGWDVPSLYVHVSLFFLSSVPADLQEGGSRRAGRGQRPQCPRSPHWNRCLHRGG